MKTATAGRRKTRKRVDRAPPVKRHKEPKLAPNQVFRDEDGIWWIPVHQVQRYPLQPRKEFDEAELNSLAAGIADSGQHNPGQVRNIGTDAVPVFELVDGERRLRACGIANKTHFKAILVRVTDDEQYIRSVALNFGRVDHSAGEVYTIIVTLRDEKKKTTQEIASILGRSPAFVTQYLELTRLHPDILALLGPPTPREKRIPVTVARIFTQLSGPAQLSKWREFARGEISMRRAQAVVREALEAGATRNGAIRARTRTPSDVVRLIGGRLGSCLELISTLADDPLFDVIVEAEWERQRKEALAVIEDIVTDAMEMRAKILGEEVTPMFGAGDGSAAPNPSGTDSKAGQSDRQLARMLRSLDGMAEALFELRKFPQFRDLFRREPFSTVLFARSSAGAVIREATLLADAFPEASDTKLYDPNATGRPDPEDDEDAGTPPPQVDESQQTFEVDPSQAPPESRKRRKPARAG